MQLQNTDNPVQADSVCLKALLAHLLKAGYTKPRLCKLYWTWCANRRRTTQLLDEHGRQLPMNNLVPSRMIQRRGRQAMLLGALVLLGGLALGAVSVFLIVLPAIPPVLSVLFFFIAVAVVVFGVALLLRGIFLRSDNEPAQQVGEALSRMLGKDYTFLRNISRPGLGYVDGILVGPPGALVFRIHDDPGMYLNEGADWLEQKEGRSYALSRLNLTRECVTDVLALRKYLAARKLTQVPVYGIVVFTHPQAMIKARQNAVPIATLSTLPEVLGADFLRENRIDAPTAQATVKAIFE